MDPQKDFFISYNKADRQWAEWIGWILEEAGYSVVIQAWDFRPGGNFVLKMQNAAAGAQKTIAVLSEDYLSSTFTQPEWAAAFAQDPTGEKGILIPIRVRRCNLEGLLSPIIYVDLVDLLEQDGQRAVLDAMKDRAKPSTKPNFPGAFSHLSSSKVSFPGRSTDDASNRIWTVPYNRNPQFTGREEVLEQLEAALLKDNTAALTQPQAIKGLGGIGKTQTVLEYAYRHRQRYDAVFWVRAELQEELIAGFGEIAQALQLPERDAQDQRVMVEAVKRSLKTLRNWLLILDNADDLTLARGYLPSGGKGHVLLTTRASATGQVAQDVPLKKMSHQEGALFLLRRAKLIADKAEWDTASEADKQMALEIAHEMDGLPLALDQAGAFIDEMQSNLAEYLALFQQNRAQLLAERGELGGDHPSVTVTFTLAFQKVAERCPAAADLLRVCAFLAPDAIPEEIFTEAASVLDEPLHSIAANAMEFMKAMKEARKFSLIERGQDKTLNIHRLVQEVLKAEMEAATHQYWLARIVLALDEVFPDIELASWPKIDRIASHVIWLANIEEEKLFQLDGIAILFNHIGTYLKERGQYISAEPLYEKSLSIWERQLGKDRLNISASLNNLVELHCASRRFFEAATLYMQTLSILKQQLSSKFHYFAVGLNNLATLYRLQGQYTKAEPLYLELISIFEDYVSSESSPIALVLNNLALIYTYQRQYDKAEPLYLRSLSILENQLGKEHPDLAIGINNLALLYYGYGKYDKAEPLYLRSLSILENQLGKEHPKVAVILHNLGDTYSKQLLLSEAETQYVRSLSIDEKHLGPDHPHVATNLNGLATLYLRQGRYTEAEQLCQRALSIDEKHLGQDHPNVATILNNLALIYRSQGRYSEVELLLRRSLDIDTKTYGKDHPEVAIDLNNLAKLYQDQGRFVEAEPLFVRAYLIMLKNFGKEHSDTYMVFDNFRMFIETVIRKGKQTILSNDFVTQVLLSQLQFNSDSG
jgi:tetratricopeptide (TPR) repeat protein